MRILFLTLIMSVLSHSAFASEGGGAEHPVGGSRGEIFAKIHTGLFIDNHGNYILPNVSNEYKKYAALALEEMLFLENFQADLTTLETKLKTLIGFILSDPMWRNSFLDSINITYLLALQRLQ